MRIGMFPPMYHLAFESLAYFVGFRVFLWMRQKDSIQASQRNWVIAGGVLGAAVGAKLIVWLDDPAWFIRNLSDAHQLIAGKGIVGALVGGWLGVEITKKIIGLSKPTGDLFVIPLILGIVIGRIGCFVTGFYDKTYGLPTTLPWGFDFGDGVVRHPTQLYEIIFMLILLIFIQIRKNYVFTEGDIFKFFMIGYLTFRFFVEFIKPTPRFYFGTNIVQVLAVAGLFAIRRSIKPMFRFASVEKEAQ